MAKNHTVRIYGQGMSKIRGFDSWEDAVIYTENQLKMNLPIIREIRIKRGK